MSEDSSWDVQAAVYARLMASGALTALLAEGAESILDHVPPGTAFPYLVLGEMQSAPMDCQGASGNEILLSLHTYSRASGMREARLIMAAVRGLLHNAAFAVTGQTLVLCLCTGSETRLEGDGLTRHGVQRFRIVTEPA